MIGDGAVIACRDLLYAQNVDQECHQLVTASGEVLCPGLHGRIVVEKTGVMVAQHSAAGTGRRHDGVVALEGFDDLRRDRPRRGTVAAVVGGLAAADLQRRYLDRAARLLEQLDRGKADRRPEQIDEAGDEKRDTARTRN